MQVGLLLPLGRLVHLLLHELHRQAGGPWGRRRRQVEDVPAFVLDLFLLLWAAGAAALRKIGHLVEKSEERCFRGIGHSLTHRVSH